MIDRTKPKNKISPSVRSGTDVQPDVWLTAGVHSSSSSLVKKRFLHGAGSVHRGVDEFKQQNNKLMQKSETERRR